jgi:hypothetical protein
VKIGGFPSSRRHAKWLWRPLPRCSICKSIAKYGFDKCPHDLGRAAASYSAWASITGGCRSAPGGAIRFGGESISAMAPDCWALRSAFKRSLMR